MVLGSWSVYLFLGASSRAAHEVAVYDLTHSIMAQIYSFHKIQLLEKFPFINVVLQPQIFLLKRNPILVAEQYTQTA